MPKKDKTEALARLTSDYLDAIVNLYKDNDAKLSDAAELAIANCKEEKYFKSNPIAELDSVSIIAIASILGF